MGYNPDQPRDDRGRWGEGGGGGGGKSVASLRAGSRQALGPNVRATGPKLTPLDTPDVLLARYNNALVPSTHTIDTQEREALRNEVAQRMYGEGGIKGREAWMVIGGPGSGKSEIGEPIAAEKGALVVDSDIAKAMLPEYEGGAGANAVHEESSEITGRVLGRAIENGDNIMIPMVGANADKAKGMADTLHAAGYRVNVVHVDVDPKVAAQRAIDRYYRSGRFVDPNYILNQVGAKPRNTYEALKRSPSVHTYKQVDNHVRHEGPGKVVEAGLGKAAARRG